MAMLANFASYKEKIIEKYLKHYFQNALLRTNQYQMILTFK